MHEIRSVLVLYSDVCVCKEPRERERFMGPTQLIRARSVLCYQCVDGMVLLIFSGDIRLLLFLLLLLEEEIV